MPSSSRRRQKDKVRYRKVIAFRHYADPEDARALGRVHNGTNQTTNAYAFHTPDERVHFANLVLSFAQGRFTGGCGMHQFFIPGAAKFVQMSTFNATLNSWDVHAALQLCVIKPKSAILNKHLHTDANHPLARRAGPDQVCVSVTYPMFTRCQKLKFCRAILGDKLTDFLKPGTVIYYSSCVDVVPPSSNASAAAPAAVPAAAGGAEDEASSDSSDEEPGEAVPEASRRRSTNPLSPSYSPHSPSYSPTSPPREETPAPVPEQQEQASEAADTDDGDTFEAQWEAITGRGLSPALAAEAEPDRAVAPTLAPEVEVTSHARAVANVEHVRAVAREGARRGAEGAARARAAEQLRELSDRLFALKETMPDESFRQLSDALMSAHNRVAA